MHRYKKYIQPAFGEKQFNDITPEHCQTLIDSILAEGKGKTAEEIHSLLSIIFKGAIAHGIVNKNPLAIVVRMKHEGKHGTALTKDEEKLLLQAYPNTNTKPYSPSPFTLVFVLTNITRLKSKENLLLR